jgi:hypothetical protein
MSGVIHAVKAALASALLIVLAATPAAAATVRDLLNLKAAGLSDDILIALIQTDGSVFYLTADDVIRLSKQGLSERVLLVMIETGRKMLQQLPVSVAAEAPPESPAYEQIAQPPVTLQVSQVNEQYVEQPQSRYADYPMTYPFTYPLAYPIAVPVFVGHVDGRIPKDGRAQPVYWGFGGQRRPDSWGPKQAPAPAPSPRRKR